MWNELSRFQSALLLAVVQANTEPQMRMQICLNLAVLFLFHLVFSNQFCVVLIFLLFSLLIPFGFPTFGLALIVHVAIAYCEWIILLQPFQRLLASERVLYSKLQDPITGIMCSQILKRI